MKLTLDTNCILDVDVQRPGMAAVLAIVDAFGRGEIDLAIVASSASERQPGDWFPDSYRHFRERIETLGLGGIPVLMPLARFDMSFWDRGIWAREGDDEREGEIYQALFPTSPRNWKDFAEKRGAAPEDKGSGAYLRWRNQTLDAQAFWAHEHAKRDIFVTRDTPMRKRLAKDERFSRARLLTPEDALAAIGFPAAPSR